MAGLSIVLPNAAFAPGNVIASLHPKAANLQALDVYNSGGAKRLLGRSPSPISVIGAPSFQANSVIGAAPGAGFDSGVPDNVTKTMLLLTKFPTVNALGAGVYYKPANDLNAGDTFALMADGTLRALMSQTGTANMSTALAGVRQLFPAGTYCLLVGEWTPTSARVRYVKDGVVTSSVPVASVSRGAVDKNIRVLASHEPISGSGYTGSMELASSAIWTGANLTEAEILSMYNFYKSLLGSQITIG
jgi:hypothetical protein